VQEYMHFNGVMIVVEVNLFFKEEKYNIPVYCCHLPWSLLHHAAG